MSIIQILSNVPYDCNIYLVKGRSAVLIDTGTGLDSRNVIDQIWNSLGGVRLSAILLTHCHIDHVGGLPDLVAEFGCPVYISEPEVSVITLPDPHVAVADMFDIRMSSVPCKKLLPDDVFDLGDHRLSVIPTPGHTAGGVCFLDEVTGSLFSGDTVFGIGFGRTDLPTGDVSSLAESLERLSKVNIGTLYPGHGATVSNGNRAVQFALRNVIN